MKYRMGYSIKEIEEVIELVKENSTKEKLKRKIIYRKMGWRMIAIFPFLYIIGLLIK